MKKKKKEEAHQEEEKRKKEEENDKEEEASIQEVEEEEEEAEEEEGTQVWNAEVAEEIVNTATSEHQASVDLFRRWLFQAITCSSKRWLVAALILPRVDFYKALVSPKLMRCDII